MSQFAAGVLVGAVASPILISLIIRILYRRAVTGRWRPSRA